MRIGVSVSLNWPKASVEQRHANFTMLAQPGDIGGGHRPAATHCLYRARDRHGAGFAGWLKRAQPISLPSRYTYAVPGAPSPQRIPIECVAADVLLFMTLH